MGAFGYRRVREELSWEYEAPKLLAAYAALERLRFKLPLPDPALARLPQTKSNVVARPMRAAAGKVAALFSRGVHPSRHFRQPPPANS